MPERTPRGKWVIYRADTGERLERWPVDARGMLETDEFTAEAPGGGEDTPAPAAEPEPEPGPEPEDEGEDTEDEPVIGIEAERASRLREQWDKATQPADYIERYGEDTDAGQLARRILDAEEAAKGAATQNVAGEAGEAEPVSLPEPRG